MATGRLSQIGLENIKWWDGRDREYSVKNYLGGVDVLHSIGAMIDVFAVTGSRDQNAISKVIARIGSTNACLYLGYGNWSITSDLTISSNVWIYVSVGSMFDISSGVTLTLPSPGNIIAQCNQQIFSGSGTVAFATGPGDLTPQMWGAVARAAADQTKDDTVAFQSCLNAASGKGRVIIGDGHYMIDSVTVQPGNSVMGLNVPSNSEIIISPAAYLHILDNASANYYTIAVYNATNVIISGGGTLYGDRVGHVGAGEQGHGLLILGSTDVYVYNITSRNMHGDGFYLGYDPNNAPYPESVNVHLINCVAYNNYRNGTSVTGVKGGSIEGGKYYDTNGTAPQDGIDIEPNANNGSGGPATVSDFIVSGIIATGNAQHGIEIDGEGTALNIDIINNHIYSNTYAGIVARSCSRVNIIGNHSHSNTRYGISVYHATNINISDNIIDSNLDHGIIIQNPSGVTTRYINITGNTVSLNGPAGIYSYGTVGKIIQDINISNNMVDANSQTTDNAVDNIYAAYTTNGVFSNNIVRHGGGANQPRYGINIAATCSNCRLVHNDTTTGGKTANVLNSSTTTPRMSQVRQSLLVINNGTVAATINPNVSSMYFGDTIGATDNVAKGATTGNFTLSADGSDLRILTTGLIGIPIAFVSAVVVKNASATDMSLYIAVAATYLRIVAYNSTAGTALDLTTLVDTGQIQVLMTYMLEN